MKKKLLMVITTFVMLLSFSISVLAKPIGNPPTLPRPPFEQNSAPIEYERIFLNEDCGEIK